MSMLESLGWVPIACTAFGAAGALTGFAVSLGLDFEVIGPRASEPLKIWSAARIAETDRRIRLWRSIGIIGLVIALCPLASATLAGLASPQWEAWQQLAWALFMPVAAVAVVITACVAKIRILRNVHA